MTAFSNILQGKAIQSINIISSFPLTSVTAKLSCHREPPYAMPCSTSINPCDLYWLIKLGYIGGKRRVGRRPMPYPRRKYNLRWVFHLRISWVVATIPDIAVRPGNKDIVRSFHHLSSKGLRNVLGIITLDLLLLWWGGPEKRKWFVYCVVGAHCIPRLSALPFRKIIFQKPSFRSLLGLSSPIYFSQKPSSGP